MKITVLAGGYSPEHDVSMLSGAVIADSLCKNGHRVAYADLLSPCRSDGYDSKFLSHGGFSHTILKTPPPLASLLADSDGSLVGDGILPLCRASDVVFLALHGGMGEDGRMQAILSAMGVPYTGSSFAACLAAMDKSLSKWIFEANKIPTADYMLLRKGEPLPKFPLPCVVKPCSCGSSVGVSLVFSEGELASAVEKALQYEDKLLIEAYIKGREFSVGILDGRALPAIEICPKGGFYDYERKYQSGMTEEICPAPLTKAEAERLSMLALRAHKALGLGSYSRIDFIEDRETGEFICLEANALPGMTPQSLFPQEAAAAGIAFDTLCERIAAAPQK